MPFKKIKHIGTTYFLTVVVAGVLFYFFGQTYAAQAMASLKSWGPMGVIAFAAVFTLGTLVFFPVTLLSFSSGVLYGTFWGFVIAISSSTLGACLAFWLSRSIFREWIQKKMQESQKFKELEQDVSKNGWKMVVLGHMSFVMPFTALNYAFGFAQISFLNYLLATFVALIPGTLLHCYLGHAAGTLAAYFKSGRTLSPVEIIFFVIAILASLGLVVYLGMLVKKFKSKN